MRKETIRDRPFQHRHTTYSLERVLRDGILRESESGNKYSNPATSNLGNPQTKYGWSSQPDGKRSESIVLINDSRKEIAQVGVRGLLTTNLLFDELLGCNRGRQRLDNDRNKFFIQDATYNSTAIHASYHIVLLDLLWYMEEKKLEAMEIVTTPSSSRNFSADWNFLSKRYGDIVNEDIENASQVTLALLKPLYKEMVERLKKEDGDTIKWKEPNYYRDWDWAGGVKNTLVSYYNYRGETKDKPVKRFPAYVKQLLAEDDKGHFTTQDYMGMIARKFNYVSISDEDYFTGIALSKSISYNWKVIAPSQFKRNRDWALNDGNFIKSEVLKLRRQMEEGTFDE